MTRTIALYVDGSAGYASGGNVAHFELGWGIVAHYDGVTAELSGNRSVPQFLFGAHERVAFVEGVLFALSHGYTFEEMVFFTDDDVIPYAGMYLHEQNGMGINRSKVEERFRTLCRKLYSDEVCERVLECMRRSRFHKVRGHRYIVDHNRADYLAKKAMKRGLKGNSEEVLDYQTWLSQGFLFWINTQEARTWFPPFVEHAENAMTSESRALQ